MNYAICKGTNWVTQYCRLAKLSKGASAKCMGCFYTSIAIPKMLYAADLFLIPETGRSKGTKGFIARLAKIQSQASLHITGAMRSGLTDAIDTCTDILPFPSLIKKIMFQAASRLATLRNHTPSNGTSEEQPLGTSITTDHPHTRHYTLSESTLPTLRPSSHASMDISGPHPFPSGFPH